MLVLADNENDSLPDNFEEKYGCLSPLKMNSAEDPDGNGIVDRKIEISAECTYLNKGDYHGQVMISSGADLGIVKVHMLVSDDVDGDWIFDLQDNCLFVPNQNQNDTDNDSYGNLCDTDLYNDNVAGLADLGVLAQDLGNSARSANQCTADFDLDGDVEGSRCADVKHRKKGE